MIRSNPHRAWPGLSGLRAWPGDMTKVSSFLPIHRAWLRTADATVDIVPGATGIRQAEWRKLPYLPGPPAGPHATDLSRPSNGPMVQ